LTPGGTTRGWRETDANLPDEPLRYHPTEKSLSGQESREGKVREFPRNLENFRGEGTPSIRSKPKKRSLKRGVTVKPRKTGKTDLG